MDTSEQYIKMCDCEEVQNFRLPKIEKMKDRRIHTSWKFEVGDTFAFKNKYERKVETMTVGNTIYSPSRYGGGMNGDIDISTVGHDEGDSELATNWIVFLPRQDQIQEWFDWRKYDVSVCWCAKPFKLEWSDDPMETFGVNGDSMEQLWLAFYMYETFGKVWNGEEWVKSDGAKGLGKVSKESSSTVTRER